MHLYTGRRAIGNGLLSGEREGRRPASMGGGWVCERSISLSRRGAVCLNKSNYVGRAGDGGLVWDGFSVCFQVSTFPLSTGMAPQLSIGMFNRYLQATEKNCGDKL